MRLLSTAVAILVTATLLVAVSSVLSAPPRQAEPREVAPNKVADFMQLKLQHAQKVLEGLAIEDLDMVAKNAQEFSLLSQAASWNVLQTEEYIQQSAEFRRTADAMTKAAKDNNLDAAAIRYVELTMKCIHCHKYVRGVRVARSP